MSFNPIKPISSRYGIKTIPSSHYQTLSGNTSGNNPGIVYLPYIMVQVPNPEFMKEMLRQDRKEKIEKLNNIFKNN